MTAIACIDKNLGIGKNNNLLVSIKEDMAFFKNVTYNQLVIMGRKTLFSFKNKMPLKNRINVVFTNDISLNKKYVEHSNIFFINNYKDLEKILHKYNSLEHFVIGGETIYNLLINKCDKLLLTELNATFDADTYFPDFHKLNFTLFSKTNDRVYNNFTYHFSTYIRE